MLIHRVTEDNTLLTGREDELLVTQENQHEIEVQSSSPNHEHTIEDENRSVDSPPIEDTPSL